MKGKVDKVVKPVYPGQKEKAQIEVEDAEPLYRELRVDNEVVDENGHKSALEPGAEVDVVIEAGSNAMTKKKLPKRCITPTDRAGE